MGRCLWDRVDKGQRLSSRSPCLSHLSPVSPLPSLGLTIPPHPTPTPASAWDQEDSSWAFLRQQPEKPDGQKELRNPAGGRGGVGTTQLPRALGERRLCRLVLRSQPQQPPRSGPRVPLTAQGKVCPKAREGLAGMPPLPPLALREASAAGTKAGLWPG